MSIQNIVRQLPYIRIFRRLCNEHGINVSYDAEQYVLFFTTEDSNKHVGFAFQKENDNIITVVFLSGVIDQMRVEITDMLESLEVFEMYKVNHLIIESNLNAAIEMLLQA